MIRFIGIIGWIFLVGCQNTLITPGVLKHPSKKIHRIKSALPKKKQTTKVKREPIVTVNQDGAPGGPVPTSFKRVLPRKEPVSRYGNPDIYHVNGHTYEVMTSAQGYHARGLASWYGTKFHSKSTSSGEPYNLYELTAAHRNLPLPTYVRVKNLNNGKEITVKVNDRGPFHSDRLIDVSYGAAVKLGLIANGTAPVEIRALTSPGLGKAPVQYYLKAGAFSSSKNAQKMRTQLMKLTNVPVFVEKYQQYSVVGIGPLATKLLSDRLKNFLAAKGISNVVSFLK